MSFVKKWRLFADVILIFLFNFGGNPPVGEGACRSTSSYFFTKISRIVCVFTKFVVPLHRKININESLGATYYPHH